MDIDAQEKHIRSLLAFKAWAEPILLTIQEYAALAIAEDGEADQSPAPEAADNETKSEVVQEPAPEQSAEGEQQSADPATDAPVPAAEEQPSESSALEGQDQATVEQTAAVDPVEPEAKPEDQPVPEQSAAPAAI